MRKLLELIRRATGVSALHDELRRATKKLEKRLGDLEVHSSLETKWRGHFTTKIDALLRRDYIADLLAEDYPAWLLSQRFKLMSQNEEDGITLALLRLAGAPNKTFVEIGSGASGGNSGVLAQEFGWRGLMVDIDDGKIDKARGKFSSNPKVSFEAVAVTPENINNLIKRHNLAGDVDLFSLDIDSFDYWVLEAMTACRPRVMIIEYNGNFGAERSVSIARGTDMSKAVKGFHGASLVALTKLATMKGYKLLCCDESGTNAFYMRADLRPEIAPVAPAVAFRPMRDSGDPLRETLRVLKDLETVAREKGLQLVEV
jgi:hypothetical protein